MAQRRIHARGHKLMETPTKQILRFPPEAAKLLQRNSAKCECGLHSPKGLTDSNVRSWHRDHKLEVLSQGSQGS
jgi:hypothetical protein